MKIKVFYHSSTGNTKKVAEAIAAAVNASPEAMTEGCKISEPIDLLFIGDGIYAGKMSKKTKAFIDQLDGSLVKNAAVFGTYGGQDKVIAAIKERLTEKGIPVCARSFLCKGQAWLVGNRNHPNQADLEEAARFARTVIDAMS